MARNSIGNLSVIISASTRGLAVALRQSQALVSSFQSNVNRAASAANSALSGIGSGLNLINPFSGLIPSFDTLKTAGVAALGALTVYSVKLAADAEQTQQAFSVMLGDANKAKQLVASVKGFAAETPFGSTELLDATRQLMAYGTSAQQIIPTLRTLGDVASATGTPLSDMAYLFGTLRTQGRAFSKDIYQFSGRGIPILEELAKVMKVNVNQVMTLTEEGKVGFREVAMAFRNMTAEGSKFGGMMDKQSQTLSGLWESLKDNAVLALEGIGQMLVEEFNLKVLVKDAIGFTQTIKDRVQGLRPLIREIVDWAKAISNAFVVGIQSAWAAAEGFAQGLNAAFNLGDKAQSLKDYLKGLQFDFKASRDAGVRMAEGLAVGLASVVDLAEEVAQSIRKINLEIMRLDVEQFKAKVLLLPERGGADRAQSAEFEKAFREMQRRAEYFDKNKVEMPKSERVKGDTRGLYGWPDKNDSEAARDFSRMVSERDVAAAAKIADYSKKIAEYQQAIPGLAKAVEADPAHKGLRGILDEQMAGLEDARRGIRGEYTRIQQSIMKAMPESRQDEFLRMVKGLEELEKTVFQKGQGLGGHAEAARKSFADLRAELTKIGATEAVHGGFGGAATRALQFNVAFNVREGFLKLQEWMKVQELEVPMRAANADQIKQAFDLSRAMMPKSEILKQDIAKLRELIDLRAFGNDAVSGVPGLGAVDVKGMLGEAAVSNEIGSKLRELERELNLSGPRLAGATLAGSTQAASIEAQFSLAGQRQDPQARVVTLLEESNRLQAEENRINRELAKAFMDSLKVQPKNAPD